MGVTRQRQVIAVMFGSVEKIAEVRRGLDRAANPNRVFVFAETEDDYVRAIASGTQPILVQDRFSLTDQRAKVPRVALPLFRAWRWRRVMLNEGITVLVLRRGRSVGVMILGALLAGVRLRFYRPGGY